MTGCHNIRADGATEEEIAALVVTPRARDMANDKFKVADNRLLAGGWRSYYRTVCQQLVYGRDAWRTYTKFRRCVSYSLPDPPPTWSCYAGQVWISRSIPAT